MLRFPRPGEAEPLLERLSSLGILHVEIAWSPLPGWAADCGKLVRRFPELALGAASICHIEALHAAVAAGFRYAVSPVLDRSLLEASAALGLTLVPGVMTPSEVHQARQWGCHLVKLFPASVLGPAYWSRLRRPLGDPLPFCIAAGGITPEDVVVWLQAGVDAVTLGSGLFEADKRDQLGHLARILEFLDSRPTAEFWQSHPNVKSD